MTTEHYDLKKDTEGVMTERLYFIVCELRAIEPKSDISVSVSFNRLEKLQL